MIISENFKVLVFISLFLKMKYVVRAHTRADKKNGIQNSERPEGKRKHFENLLLYRKTKSSLSNIY